MTLIQEVTSTPISWQLVSVIIITLLFLGWMAFLLIRRPKSRPSADPIVKSAFIVGVLLFILILMDVFVFTDEEFIKKYAWIIFPGLFFIMFSLNYYYRKKLVPLKFGKLKAIAEKIMLSLYDAEVYTSGTAFGFGLQDYHRVKITEGENLTMISLFLFMDNLRHLFLIGLDSFVGDELIIKPNPNLELITDLFDKSLADRYDPSRYELIRGLLTDQLKGQQKQQDKGEEPVATR